MQLFGKSCTKNCYSGALRLHGVKGCYSYMTGDGAGYGALSLGMYSAFLFFYSFFGLGGVKALRAAIAF
jgi:hypothetical protein